MHVLVEVAFPLDVGQNVEVVFTALIPVAADVGLREVQRGVEQVEPIVDFERCVVDRSLGGLRHLGWCHDEHALRGIGCDEILLGRLGQGVHIVVNAGRACHHGAVAQHVDALRLLCGIVEPLLVGVEREWPAVVDRQLGHLQRLWLGGCLALVDERQQQGACLLRLWLLCRRETCCCQGSDECE